VFEFLKNEKLVARYFEKYIGQKPVVLYKKLHFVPIGRRIFAFDYEGEGRACDITEACEACFTHMVK